METIRFTDEFGSFNIKNPQNTSYLYFPVAGDGGIKSSITPLLSGDAKLDQNTFLLAPASSENLHNDRSSRNFWCGFDGNRAWSVTGASAEAEAVRGTDRADEHEINAGFMWHELVRTSKEYGLKSSVISFVPSALPNTEVMLVRIENVSNESVSFEPVAAIPMYARSADNIRDHRHVTSLLHRAVVTKSGVEIFPTLTFDERGHKLNDKTYYVYGANTNAVGKEAAKVNPVAVCPSVEDYIGEGGTFTRPLAVYDREHRTGLVTEGATLDGYETIGALFFEKCTLKPGEHVAFAVLGGICEGKEENVKAGKLLASYTEADWLKTLEETKKYWQEQVNVSFSTGDKKFDNTMRWVAFQPILRRIYGCSFLPHHDYGKGGRGWRDLWQDCLALLIMNPSGVRRMLIDNFGGVRFDGSNATIIGSGQGEFIADRNNITRVWMDHGFWPLHTTAFYIHQTGDINILFEKAPYFKDRQVVRGEEKDDEWDVSYGTRQRDVAGKVVEGTLLEHILMENLTSFYDVGEHNRIRLRGADWNDAVDMASHRGESVAFSYAYAGNFGTLAALLRELKAQGTDEAEIAEELFILLDAEESIYTDCNAKRELLLKYCHEVFHNCSGKKVSVSISELADKLETIEKWWKETLRTEEWLQGNDKTAGGFFNGYYDDNGRRVENNSEDNLRMMLTGQVFAIMSKTASKEQTAEIVKAADANLFHEKSGGYALNTNFHELKTDLGRMFGFAYGHKENGAVFSHMAVMYGNALYQRGFAREGFKSLNSLYKQSADFETSRIYPGIPEYFDGRGRGLYHYLTGAASWYLMTVLIEMFGVKGCLGNLVFEPKLLNEQFDENGQAKVNVMFSGKKLNITYETCNVSSLTRDENSVIKVCELYINGTKQSDLCISKATLETFSDAETTNITVKLQ